MADETPQPGTEAGNPIDDAKVKPSSSTFGFSSWTLPTPKKVEAAFDIYLIVTTAFLGWMAATNLFSPDVTKEIVYAITLLATPIVKGLSKLFGIKVDDGK